MNLEISTQVFCIKIVHGAEFKHFGLALSFGSVEKIFIWINDRRRSYKFKKNIGNILVFLYYIFNQKRKPEKKSSLESAR